MRTLILVWITSIWLHHGTAWGDDCSLTGIGSLGVPLVEHSCFHTELGPFTKVLATAGTRAITTTPDINAVHTHYTVELPSLDASVVTYTPARSGTWAAFGNGETPVTITDLDGVPLRVLLEVPVKDCDALPTARVVSLEAGRRYLVRFGPTSAANAIVVLEKLADFDTPYGRDGDGDGFGGDREVVSTPCAPPAGFVASTDDCDDQSLHIHPGATEVCDGIDQDCDSVADDGACTLTGAGCAVIDSAQSSSCPLVIALMLGIVVLRRRLTVTSMSLVLVLVLTAESAAEQCDQLGLPCVDHTCLHARAGPFADVKPTQTSTPAIDAVHTLFRISLDGSGDDRRGVVTYRPARSGTWALFTDADVPVAIRDSDGTQIPTQRDQRGFGCSYLIRVTQHELIAGVTYQVELGPSPASRIGLVLEYVDDFVTLYSRDRDGDGRGDPSSTIATACVPPAGYVLTDDDCADHDATISPAVPEDCGSIDRNCNGSAADGGLSCSVGIGACQATGTASCSVVEGPLTCSATPLSASSETCNGVDDDCDGEVDDGDLCLDPRQPRCVGDSRGGRRCGCDSDLDCGGADSGRFCLRFEDIEECVAGCVAGNDRNRCPAGHACSSADPAVPGICEPVATAGCQASADVGAGGWQRHVLVALIGWFIAGRRRRRTPG